MNAPPTIAELNTQIVADLAGALEQSIPLLPKSFLRVLAKVLAATVIVVYKYAGWSALQLFVAHASTEESIILGKKIRPLVEWGRLIGVGDPEPATRAELVVSVSVLTQGGALASSVQLVRSESGVVYEVAFPVPLDADTISATIRPVSDQQDGDGAGTIGNLAIGDTLSFANGPADVGSEVTVTGVTKLGAEAEDVTAYRQKIFQRFQRKPQGGAYADYELWGLEAADVANIYPYAANTPGVVDVYVESSTEDDGIPTPEQLAVVAAAINQDVEGIATRRPVNAAIRVRRIRRRAFNVTVVGLQPDSAELRAEINDGLSEHFASRAPFIEGLSSLPRDDRITQAAVSGIVDGIVNAAGATVNGVTVTPGPAYTLGRGEKARLGVVTYG